MQYVSGTRWKLDLRIFCVKKGSFNTWSNFRKKYQDLVEIIFFLILKIRCDWEHVRKGKNIFQLAQVCKQIICKSSSKGPLFITHLDYRPLIFWKKSYGEIMKHYLWGMHNCDAWMLVICLCTHLLLTKQVLKWIMKTYHKSLEKLALLEKPF